MTATVLLIRHAAHPHLGKVLSGRTQGVALSSEGEAQAARLARRLGSVPIDLLQSSPVERALQTAGAIAAARPNLQPQIVEALHELDFGDWAGLSFAELAEDPGWQGWNEARAAATAPNGESMAAAQARAWDHIAGAAAAHPDRTIAMVTHCDIIRAVVARVLGLSLDNIQRFDVEPASVTKLVVGPWGAKLATLNGCCDE